MFEKISTKFLIWFLLISLVPFAVVGYLNYGISKKSLTKERLDSLKQIANGFVHDIEDHISRKTTNLATLAHSPTIIDAIESFTTAYDKGVDSAEYLAIDKKFRPFLKYYQQRTEHYDLFLINQAGDIIFTVIHESDFATNLISGPYKDSELAKVFEQATVSSEISLSDYKYYPPSGKPAAFIATAILKNGKPVGVVALQLSIEAVFEHAQNYSGLGKTGETVLAAKIGNEAVFISPLRHDPGAAFKRKVTIGSSEALLIQEAVQGISGNGFSIDYRGKEILAEWRYLPSLRWGMVVKIDRAETFAPIYNLRYWSLTIGIITAFLVILFAVIASKSFSNPITKLVEGTYRFRNRDFSARVPETGPDEIVKLGQAFNEMATEIKKSYELLEEEITEKKEVNLNLEIEIKERKQAEEALQKAHDELDIKVKERTVELEQSNIELQRFAYVASHDLQEPLRKIRNYTELLEKRYKDRIDDKADKFINYIVDGATRMQGLISDLLSYSRVDSQGREMGPINSTQILEQVMNSMQVTIDKNGAEITHGPLPLVMADEVQLGQLFQNLIGNSIKFKNSDPVQIHIAAEKKNDEWIFSVRDNGIGIEPEYAERIFEIFQRLHSQADYPGTGIGLAICKKIVERHGGRIWMRSELDKGATFYFTLNC